MFSVRQVAMVGGDYVSCWRAFPERLNKGTTNTTRTASHDNIHMQILADLRQQCPYFTG
jgi:hypothetical protein